MLFAQVAATSIDVAATSSRSAKRDAIAGLLQQLDRDEIAPVVAFLVGAPRQGRIGVGWRTIAAAERDPAEAQTLTITEIDETLSALAALGGPGSATARQELLGRTFERATSDEASFLARLIGGELRQGSLAGVMTDAVAAAARVPVAVVRRAVMLGGSLEEIAVVALTDGRAGLEGVRLEPGRPLQPMLASTAASVTEAVEAIGAASVEWKLDGIRIQVHRTGDDVRVWTRNLNEITDRLPSVVTAVRSMPVDTVVLDGEALSFDVSGRPQLFQDSVSWRPSSDAAGAAVPDAEGSEDPDDDAGLRPFFFDILHVDGADLIDAPLTERRLHLERVAGPWRIPGTITDHSDQAEQVLADALGAGHEGVVVKAADSRYEAGRRGKSWRKVKPVHTLDLVVLAVEWGHGRRRGWLSNLHLGARSDDDNGFVMVGKTFKGLTDELLRWQTERFLDLAVEPPDEDADPHGVVWVRPEQVVEIAVDGVQRSTRYSGGVALRFARVVRYRDDKAADQADLLTAVRGLLPS